MLKKRKEKVEFMKIFIFLKQNLHQSLLLMLFEPTAGTFNKK